MIDTIPSELFTIVGKHLSYIDLQNVSNVINIGVSDEDMFVNSILFHNTNIYLQNALDYHDITPRQFFNILIDSALYINDIYKLLIAITNNHITSVNKYDYNITINYRKKNNLFIKNTIIVTHIVMRTMEHHVTNEFVINNPYHYTSINITNTVLHYFQTIISTSYRVVKDIESNSFKFNLMMFERPWYKSNINIYHVFLLYLLNINVISSRHISEIYDICNNSKHISHKSSLDYPKEEFISNVFNMFQDRDHLLKLNQMMYPISS